MPAWVPFVADIFHTLRWIKLLITWLSYAGSLAGSTALHTWLASFILSRQPSAILPLGCFHLPSYV